MKWVLTFCLCSLPLAALSQTHEERTVAAVLMGEAWSEQVRGMTAVAEVIRQRARDTSRTPLQIVTAHQGRVHAFSCLNGTTPDQLINKFRLQPDYQVALQIAMTVCRTPDRLPGITRSANHFTRKDERPFWARGKRPVAIIGRHAFYKLKYG